MKQGTRKNAGKTRLWTRNFLLVTVASTMGSAGAIAGSFALSFLVFDETESTLASALVIAIQLFPYVLVPLFAAPVMDRLPRKFFLVLGDVCNGVIYAAMGAYLLRFEFSYLGYLAVSVVLACLGSLDELAYTSIYPDVIPKGLEQKGYAVSSMLYPILKVIMMPAAAILLDTLGVPLLLVGQGCLSLCAAVVENQIRIHDENRLKQDKERYSLKDWWQDVKEAAGYIKKERGLAGLYGYMAVTNGVASGYASILVAFFRTAPGMNAAMYSLFSVAEFFGRTVGSMVQYRIKIAGEKKFGFVFFVYQIYELMDMCLLWLPYPLMLVNRGICGFLGNNSAIVRNAAVQSYLPQHLRARVNAFSTMLLTLSGSVFALLIGALGELLDHRLCMTVCGATAFLACWLLIWRKRTQIHQIFLHEQQEE